MITKLKIEIDKSGYKQNWLAVKLGIDYTLLSHYVRGERIPPESTIKKIAKILKVSSEDLKDDNK